MIIKVNQEKQPKVFTTFSLTITATNIDDLKRLWHCFNVPSAQTTSDRYYYDNTKIGNIHEAWGVIDDELKKYTDENIK